MKKADPSRDFEALFREHGDRIWRAVFAFSGDREVISAQGQGGKRNQPCNGVNYDLFRIPAYGSAKAVAVTNTAGTGIESAPAWGWSE